MRGRVTLALTLATVILTAAIYYLLKGPLRGSLVAMASEVVTALEVAVGLASAFVFYKLSSKGIRAAILRARGTEGDVKMLLGLWRTFIIFMIILIVIGSVYELGVIGGVIAAFGGMFLGWSLQSPVSGFAAWLIVTLKRPFRVGDRVQLPSYGLVGDVLDVGPMYTILNQVGGAVGSEEAVGRHILIPNAMLFGNLVINYTPRWEKEPPKALHSQKESEALGYILDEVVARITFDSDWQTAENILLNAAREVTADIIEATGQEPYIRSDMYDYGVYMRLRYMTLATDRPRITHEITKKIFNEFSKSDKVDFAIPFVYSYKKAASGVGPVNA